MVRGVPRMCIRISGRAVLCCNPCQLWIAAQTRNVVNNFAARSQREFRHCGLLRVHGNGNLQFCRVAPLAPAAGARNSSAAEIASDPGPRGLCANINDVRAV